MCTCGCGQDVLAPARYVRGHNRRGAALDPFQGHRIDPDTGCWEWTRGRTSAGYGVIPVDRKATYAHRAYYEHHRGPIPDGFELDHLCRSRGCVNPWHLEPVTCAQNIQRGRLTKLQPDQVLDVIRLVEVELLSRSQVAALFGVTHQNISGIIAGLTWSAVTGRRRARRRAGRSHA